MKFLLVLTSVLAVALAQRPWYAGSQPIGYPGLANRFKTDDNTPVTSNAVDNFHRYYERPPAGIPIDAHGDVDLVNKLNSWSRENRPFWILNADQIEAHRGTNRYAPGHTQQGLRGGFENQDGGYHTDYHHHHHHHHHGHPGYSVYV